jgi:uncharacterized cupin superfamily protein
MKHRPEFIRHWRDIEDPVPGTYDGSEEALSQGAPFGRIFGFKSIGIHHERLPPGRRTSWPHAEKTEEEFVFVIEGTPDVWIDGELHRLQEGEGVGFVPGTGIAHTFINNSDTDVRLLVVGEHLRADNQYHYPLHPRQNEVVGKSHWKDAPRLLVGSHDGLPDRLRETNGPF